MGRGQKVEGEFKVQSLTWVGTLEADRDVGVVRVSGAFLQKHTRRNALLRISLLDDNGRKQKSIVRIVRAATTGDNPLHMDGIALQYDDRVELGIKSVGTKHKLRIEQVNDWLALPKFLLGHPSPLVRRKVAFGIALMIVGGVLGAVIGFIVGLTIQEAVINSDAAPAIQEEAVDPSSDAAPATQDKAGDTSSDAAPPRPE